MKKESAPEEEPAQTFASVRDILSANVIPSDRIVVTLDSGHVIQFDPPRDSSAMAQCGKHAAVLQKLWEGGMCSDDAVKPWLPVAPESIRYCVFLERYSVSPKLTLPELLEMVKTCGLLVPEMFGKFMTAAGMVTADKVTQELDDAKNA